MQFNPPMQPAILLRRYKRFLADVVLNGQLQTVHCPNTGSMRACIAPESPCWLATHTGSKRKYPHSLTLVTTPQGHLAGIHSALANPLVAEALAKGVITPLQGYDWCKQEAPYGAEGSRADFYLQAAGRMDCYVEVKNVSLLDEGQGYFPDAITLRGQKHLRELAQLAANGQRAVMLFCVQHEAITSVAPAAHIDPHYAHLCREAAASGVEFYAYKAQLSPHCIQLTTAIPVVL